MASYNGTEGDDVYTGTPDGDTILGNGGNDTLNGAAGQDLVDGGAGDPLDGGAGADILRGAAGDDFYIVDDIGDQLVEWENSGHEVVWSYVSFALSTHMETLVLKGEAAINGTGNDLANHILGNNASNTLFGGEGNDTLNGLGGNDLLQGGNGDDTYYADGSNDVMLEAAGAGRDFVITSVSHTLSDNIEYLILGTDWAIDGTGNGLDNGIYGNDFINVLDGGAGDDDLIGEGGNDTLIGGAGVDTAHFTYAGMPVDIDLSAGASSGGDGNDTLISIENIIGSLFGDHIRGDAGSNHLNGLDGDDTIAGGGGTDLLEGWLGNDTFRDTAAGFNGDTIVDFRRAKLRHHRRQLGGVQLFARRFAVRLDPDFC